MLEGDRDACFAILETAQQRATAEPEKQWATLQARAALRGIVLIDSNTDSGRPEWIASWQALTKAFGSLAELDAWLSRVEGKR